MAIIPSDDRSYGAFDRADSRLFGRYCANAGHDALACYPDSKENAVKSQENRAIIINSSQEVTNMKLHLPSKKFIVSSFSLLVAIAVLLTVVSAVYAEGEGPLTPIPGLGRVPNETLVRMHKQEVAWYNDQEALFKMANTVSAKLGDLIAREASAKKDVSIMQACLDTFNGELTSSREIHAVAGTAIFTLVGFRASGDVYNRLPAGQSILDGRESLREANFRMIDAMNVARKCFDKWRHDRIRNPYSYK
jgi:hypothetical protein